MTLTVENLAKIVPGANPQIVQATVESHNKYASQFEINTPLREAHFIAQIAHESAGLKTTVEYGGPNTRYAPWYGRGLIQLTWEANYKAFTLWCEKGGLQCPDFDTPTGRDQVAEFPWAYISAVYYWSTHGLNQFADQDDILTITKRINGGENGLDSRKAFLARAKVALGIAGAVPPVFTGPSLLQIQQRLIALGYRITADGKDGPLTQAAIRVFQKMHNLTPDGVAGPNTLKVLFANVNS